MSNSGEGQKGTSSQQNRVQVPEYLRPAYEQAAGTATRALSSAEELSGGPLVAGLNADQNAGIQQARDVAGGAGGYIPAYQDMLKETAGGRSLESFLDPTAFASLSNTAGGSGFGSSLPPEVLAALTGTASGSNLYGGAGFDAAVKAAVNSATPHIASAFGGTRGGLSGSLARQAVGDTAVDTFASRVGDERRNQLAASGLLADVGSGEASRRNTAAGLLANLSGDERNRQEAAGRSLPGAGLISSDILSQIGGAQQQQSQAELSAPLDAQLKLLSAALGFDLTKLLGADADKQFQQIGLGFGDA